MYSKGLGKIFVIAGFILISGCASTKSAHLGCDFVGGAAENAIERHENKGKSDIHGNKVKNNQNSDFLEGILSVFSGILTRSVSSDNKNKSKCT